MLQSVGSLGRSSSESARGDSHSTALFQPLPEKGSFGQVCCPDSAFLGTALACSLHHMRSVFATCAALIMS